MKKITTEELRDYFKENNYFIRYKNKVEILVEDVKERGVAGEVSVTLPIYAGHGQKINLTCPDTEDQDILSSRRGNNGRTSSYQLDLVAEYKTMEEFIEQTHINSIDDLQHIRRSIVSSQVIKGSGFFNCMVKELDNASICFRVENGETIVYSTDLHYYDELGARGPAGRDPRQTALTLPEQLIEYIEERIERLGTYAALVMKRGGFEQL